MRQSAVVSSTSAARADAEASAARIRGDMEAAERHDRIAASHRSAGAWYERRAALDEKLMEDRAAWEQTFAGSGHLALAADTELRRRNPKAEIAPLRSAEPAAPETELGGWLDPEATAQREARAHAGREAFAARLEERQAVIVPAEDPDFAPLGEAWPAPAAQEREAILQEPSVEMPPAPGITRQAEAEAGA
jgi:hypothetical protein